MPGKHASLEERLWRRVDKNSDPRGCWIWLGGLGDFGYGQICEGPRYGKNFHTHRISWQLSKGPIPEGMFVLHKCDNPRCVNPEHLFLGTQLENMRDRSSKGRAPTGDRNPMRTRFPESRERAKKILELSKSGKLSQTAIAKSFNVHQSLVSRIIGGKRWGGVPRQLTT